MAELDFIDVLRQAKASDADMPFPSGTPEALLQHNAPRSLEEFPSRKDPDPAAEVDSEEKSGGGGPPEDPAGSGHPFQGVDVTETGSSSKLLRVIYGTISGEAPTGMSLGDDPAYVLTASGSQIVYVCVTISSTTGAITSRTIGQAGTIPADGVTTFYYQLLSYTITSGRLYISQAVAGSLAFQACPFWYSNPRSWTPSWGPV